MAARLPADHAAFIAINRLSARGLIPVARDEVDFQPDAPATKEWITALLKACDGYVLAKHPLEGLTRGEAANIIWRDISRQPAPEWKRLQPNDADADSIPDLDDPLPFQAQAIW